LFRIKYLLVYTFTLFIISISSLSFAQEFCRIGTVIIICCPDLLLPRPLLLGPCLVSSVMGLFSIFDSQESEDSTGSGDINNNKPSPSLDLPCVVQLYNSRPVRLEAAASVPPYAMLSYSAVALGATKEETVVDLPSLSPSKRQNKKALPALVPELGVWNVCVSRPGSDTLLLLPPKPAVSAFCLTVDLSDPRKVEPTLTSLQDALVRYLIARPPPPPPPTTTTTSSTQVGDMGTAGDNDNSGTSEGSPSSQTTTSTAMTTSLHDLRTVSFGLAAQDAESASKLQKSQAVGVATDKDRAAHVALVICARRAPPVGKNDYRAKQAQALLYYHLRRYASALKATLCFVDGAGDVDSLVDDDPNDQPVVDPAQLAYIFRELATGKPLNLSAPELSTGENSGFAFVYTAANHNPELIESVLLRNANYPGEWDAAKESLWKVLPPPPPPAPPSSASATEARPDAPAGDDPWLAELRDSVAAATSAADAAKTPAKATRKEVAPDSAQKDAAVSSFFESLLK
jgi:hypothetical protein